MPRARKKEMLSQIGASPRQIGKELRAFSRAAKRLSSDRPRLIDRYAKQWIGLYDSKVEASAGDLASLLAALRKKGLSPNNAVIRYIDKRRRKLIL